MFFLSSLFFFPILFPLKLLEKMKEDEEKVQNFFVFLSFFVFFQPISEVLRGPGLALQELPLVERFKLLPALRDVMCPPRLAPRRRRCRPVRRFLPADRWQPPPEGRTLMKPNLE